MGTLERHQFSVTCGIYLFLIYKELRICQEFFIVLLTSFLSLLVAWGPLLSCPWVLGIYSPVVFVFFISDSHFLLVPPGSTEGGACWASPAGIFPEKQSGGELETGVSVLIVRFLWLRILAQGPVSCSFSCSQTCLERLQSFLMKTKGSYLLSEVKCGGWGGVVFWL